ncbi:hypothetical protein TNCV_1682771 [Trichonephila clavipes]|nr:hypothetical protein TNCV_1682771 [Trichonephila clavipes]
MHQGNEQAGWTERAIRGPTRDGKHGLACMPCAIGGFLQNLVLNEKQVPAPNICSMPYKANVRRVYSTVVEYAQHFCESELQLKRHRVAILV